MDEFFSYRNLRVYQQAKDFVIYVYRLLKQFSMELLRQLSSVKCKFYIFAFV